jgi:uncharacterized protein YbjT (DUF2867 family)
MKIFLTGSTGYIGQSLISYLIDNKIEIRALIRPQSIHNVDKKLKPTVEILSGDVTVLNSIRNRLHGCDAIIYIPGLIREFPRKGLTFRSIHYDGVKNFVDEALRSNIRRFILISANGVRENVTTQYLKTKYEAEEYLKKSGLDWTILRPSVVFGNEENNINNFINIIINLLKKTPFVIPIIGDGNYRFQPISIFNLSEVILRCLYLESSIGKIYSLCGRERFSYNELVDILSLFVKKKKIKLHFPIAIIKIISKLLERYEWFPVTYEQIIMLEEENICQEKNSFFEEMGVKPILLSEYYKIKRAGN